MSRIVNAVSGFVHDLIFHTDWIAGSIVIGYSIAGANLIMQSNFNLAAPVVVIILSVPVGIITALFCLLQDAMERGEL